MILMQWPNLGNHSQSHMVYHRNGKRESRKAPFVVSLISGWRGSNTDASVALRGSEESLCRADLGRSVEDTGPSEEHIIPVLTV